MKIRLLFLLKNVANKFENNYKKTSQTTQSNQRIIKKKYLVEKNETKNSNNPSTSGSLMIC